MSTGDRSKGVHVKLDRETHIRFKLRLVERELTMQEAFEEFAKCVARGNLSALGMMERMLRERVKAELKEAGVTPRHGRRKPRYVTQLDDDGLYALIGEGEESEGS